MKIKAGEKCGPQSSSINITQELVYKYNFSGPIPDLLNQEFWDEDKKSVFYKISS